MNFLGPYPYQDGLVLPAGCAHTMATPAGTKTLREFYKTLMKITVFVSVVAATAVLVVGCKQKSETETQVQKTEAQTTTTSQDLKQAVTEQAAAVQKAATEASAQIATQAKEAAAAAQATGNQAVAAVQTQAQTLIDKAKSLVTDKKYQDALNTLQQLSNLKLTPEQEKVVTDLKTQIQKLLASQGMTNAAGALGNLLGK